MSQTQFLSHYEIDEEKIVRIEMSEFLMNVALDFGIVIFGFLVWRYILWVPINRMRIPVART